MKKRIVLIAIAVIGGWFFLSSAVFAGEQMALTKRGPGPDWGIQQGTTQPVGSPTEAALRGMMGSLPTTGHLMWGSGFNDNLAEIDRNPANADVQWSDERSFSGAGSIKISTPAVAGQFAGIYKYITQKDFSKHGIAFAIYPVIDTAIGGDGLQHLDFGFELNYFGTGATDKHINYYVRIAREAGNVTRVYYQDPWGAWQNTGLNIGEFFVHFTDAYPWTWWRTVKLVVEPMDPSGFPRYLYLEIDGIRYNMSTMLPLFNPVLVFNRAAMFSFVTLMTDEAVAHIIYLDDMGLTDEEP
jgi:hypothetical protein